MLHSFIAITLAVLASPPVGDLPYVEKWGIVPKIDMSSGMVYDEVANVWNIGGRLISGQVHLSDEEVSINIAVRGCLDGATDYRQTVTFPVRKRKPKLLRSRL